MQSIKLNNTGKLYSYSIVFRSFPGIEVPYISAIVDLDGGGTVKGNLIDCEPDPDKTTPRNLQTKIPELATKSIIQGIISGIIIEFSYINFILFQKITDH